METMYVTSKKELVAAIRLAVDEPIRVRWKREGGGVTQYEFPMLTAINNHGVEVPERPDRRQHRILAVAKRAAKLAPEACK